MAVQAQLFNSDHYPNYIFGPQDWALLPLGGGEYLEEQRVFGDQKMVNSSGFEWHNVGTSSSARRFGLHSLSCEIERQRVEMDCFLHFQNEKLKAILNEETRKRELIMMHNYESKMKAIIDAKDQLLNTATTRTKELQNYLQMAEQEAKNWETKAMETEAMVSHLNTRLKQASRHEDAESVYNGPGLGEGQERQDKMVCKICHVRSSCILLLPCRHLCCCSACEGLLMFCPVCESVKNGGLEVIFGEEG